VGAEKPDSENPLAESSLPFVDLPLARRLETAQAYRSIHYARAYADLHLGVESTHMERGGGYAVFISSASPVNKALGFGLEGPVSREDIATVEEFFSSRGARPVINVCPLADHGLLELLAVSGFHLAGFHTVLWRRLADFEAQPLPPGMRITRAGPEEAQQWLEITAQGFEEVDKPSPDTYDILGPNFHAPSSACYFARLDEQPIAGGGMYLHGGVVELGGASTVPAFRQRGAQRGLIERRMLDAREQGCDIAMILTEPGSNSQRNAQRLGFSLAYTQVILQKVFLL
jgi:hypothetical protein